MKNDIQEPVPNPLLTRRASLLALMIAPGAVGAGLINRPALADEREQLAAFRKIRPDTWATLYEDPPDMSAFGEAYRDPSHDNMMEVAKVITDPDNQLVDEEEKNTLTQLIDNLFDSHHNSLEKIREGISEVVDNINEGVNRVTDAIGVIALGALEAVQNLNLDGIREWVAKHIYTAIEGILTMGSLLTIAGQTPIKHPLVLVVGAFVYAAAIPIESRC